MNPRAPSDPLTPEEARARDALRALERPRADVTYRERLKLDFVAGRIGERRVPHPRLAWYRQPAWRLAPVADLTVKLHRYGAPLRILI